MRHLEFEMEDLEDLALPRLPPRVLPRRNPRRSLLCSKDPLDLTQ